MTGFRLAATCCSLTALLLASLSSAFRPSAGADEPLRSRAWMLLLFFWRRTDLISHILVVSPAKIREPIGRGSQLVGILRDGNIFLGTVERPL